MVARFIARLPGRLLDPLQRRSLVIKAAPAFAGFGLGRRIGRGRDAASPTVADPTIHVRPALPPPAALSLVGQNLS